MLLPNFLTVVSFKLKYRLTIWVEFQYAVTLEIDCFGLGLHVVQGANSLTLGSIVPKTLRAPSVPLVRICMPRRLPSP